jgi:hypothetical protein
LSFKPDRKKKAQFAPDDVPPGSICLSSFVVITDGRGGILAGPMDRLDIWLERFYVSPVNGPSFLASGKLLLPASHLVWYESPLDAAERVVKEMTLIDDLPRDRLKLIDAQSHLRPSSKDPSLPHWDICMVYRVDSYEGRLKRPEWFKEFGFRSDLKVDDFARGHGDILEEAGLLSKN